MAFVFSGCASDTSLADPALDDTKNTEIETGQSADTGSSEEGSKNDSTDCMAVAPNSSVIGITLSATDVTPMGLTLICNQSGGEVKGEIQTGTTYFLEKEVDGTWQELGPLQDFGFEDVAIIIQKGEETEWEIDWSNGYGSLEAGKYRIGKEFGDYIASEDQNGYTLDTSYTCYAEFEVKDTSSDNKAPDASTQVQSNELPNDDNAIAEEPTLDGNLSDNTSTDETGTNLSAPSNKGNVD